MRINKLRITRFKNLGDFSVTFDEQSPTTVLVGRNGTGKSNLLEALTIIFRDLDLGADPAFDYVLEYVCRNRRVTVESSHHHTMVKVDDESISPRQLAQTEGKKYLPSYVFGYYSGPSSRMEEHFETHQNRFYRDLLAGKDQPLRPLFYARPIHSQFVLLAFFLKKDANIQRFLRDELWIEELDSVLFVMTEPPWKSSEGDERFWMARGTVSQFLDKLYALALAPLRLERRVSAGFRKTTTREHLYLYLKDVAALCGLAEHYGTEQDLFKALEPGFPFWTSRPSPLYTQNLLPGPICCCGPLGMPSNPSAGCARRSRRANRRGSGTFLRHLPHIAPCRRPRPRDAIGRQPAGTGSAQIRWSIAPNSRRVRWLSASRSQ